MANLGTGVCVRCEKVFLKKRRKQVFCEEACRRAFHNARYAAMKEYFEKIHQEEAISRSAFDRS